MSDDTPVNHMGDEERQYLKELLTERIVKIFFTTVDGKAAEITGTTKPVLLPAVKPLVEGEEPVVKKERKANPDVLNFFSIDRMAWRSVRYDSIKSIEIMEEV